ncbi:MAG: hypothetical protein IPM94_11455 [bacterium]|nr:hypothetical protein [bacterium]
MRKSFTGIIGLLFLFSMFAIGCGDNNNPGTLLTGTITIDPEPNDINAPWVVMGPSGFNQSGSGDATLEDVTAGEYSLTWGDVSGWTAPSSAPVTLALVADATLQFTGTYIDRFPFPDTADNLMTNFKNAYVEMNVGEYSNVLHSDFIFVFADWSDVAPPSGIYTREEDLQSTTNMFSGDQGQSPDGQPIPAVRDIAFQQLVRLTEWEDVPETHPYFPGASRALYDVLVVFNLVNEGWITITVDTQQLFYVKAVAEEEKDGDIQQHFYLIGQQDLDGKSAVLSFASNEDMSWSIVKALYL